MAFKRVIQHLRRGDELLQLLLDNIHDHAVFVLDRDGQVMTWNAGAERILGYPGPAIIGHSYGQLHPPAERVAGEPQRALELALRDGRHEGESWRLRKDGSRVWVNDVIHPLRDRGVPAGFVVVTHDHTERREAAEALRLCHWRFRTLIDAVNEYAIYIMDPDGRISSWNSGARRITGYTAHEVIGRHYSLFFTEEDRGRGLPERALAQARSEGRCHGAGWRRRKDGSRFWADVVLEPITGPDGRLEGFAKVTRDVTERREAEEALRLANEELESRVEERTRELAAANAELRRLATTDPLTGIPNRRHLFEMGEAEVERCRRYSRPLTALIIDLDRFKAINDSLGHAVGDAALMTVVERMAGQLRTGDVMGRLGGDEFAALLLETGVDEAIAVAQRLREEVAARPVVLPTAELSITVSVGMAQWRAGDALEDLLQRADTALRAAKGADRNRVVIAEE